MPSGTLPTLDPNTTIDPYAVLSVPHTASDAEIRSAYKKLALKHHPDKVPPTSRATAHTTFQHLALAYAILSSPARRSLYNRTGSTAESLLSDSDPTFSWPDFFRAQYAELVTPAAIDGFKARYQSSAEETRDVLAAYVAHKGKMTRVYGAVMLSNPIDDEVRFRGIIDQAIEAEEVEGYVAYTGETDKQRERRMKSARRQAVEAERHAADLGLGEKVLGIRSQKGSEKGEMEGAQVDELAALIQQRGVGRQEAFLQGLEAKYAGKGVQNGRKRKVQESEPDEEAFERMRKKGRNGEEQQRARARKGKGDEIEQRAKGKARAKRSAKKAEVEEEDEGVNGNGPEEEEVDQEEEEDDDDDKPTWQPKRKLKKGVARRKAAKSSSG